MIKDVVPSYFKFQYRILFTYNIRVSTLFLHYFLLFLFQVFFCESELLGDLFKFDLHTSIEIFQMMSYTNRAFVIFQDFFFLTWLFATSIFLFHVLKVSSVPSEIHQNYFKFEFEI